MRLVRQGAMILLVAVAVVGCADPARDKPDAVVTEAAPTTRTASAGERYVISEASKIEFVGSKVTGRHDGGFRGFEGEITLVGNDPTKSTVRVDIDTTTLWADNDRLAGHLKSADFFDVENYPTATFESTEIRPEDDGFRITGNLDLHGVTKGISFPAQIAVEPGSVRAEAEFSIKRFDFGIAYKGMADDLIRDEVVIRLDLRAAPGA